MSNKALEPSTIAYPMASSIYHYFRQMLDDGAVSGGLGKMDLNPKLAPLLEGIHRILAGGEVEVKITSPGSPDVYDNLVKCYEQGLEDANAINKAAGYYVSITP